MKDLSNIKRFYPEGDNKNGVFRVDYSAKEFYLVMATDNDGFDHVSVSKHRLNGANVPKCPSSEEMRKIKEIFFEDDEIVYQIYPKRSEYVNEHPYCLHMWKPNREEYIIPDKDEVNGKIPIEESTIPIDNVLCHYQLFDLKDWIYLRAWLTTKDLKPVKSGPTWEQKCQIRKYIFKEEEACAEYMFDSNNPSGMEIFFPKSPELLKTPDTNLVGRK